MKTKAQDNCKGDWMVLCNKLITKDIIHKVAAIEID